MRIKRIILATISLIVVGAFCLFVFYLPKSYVVPILMYHNINEKSKVSKLSVSPESFRRQMKFLHDFKYKVISLDELVDLIKQGEDIPYKTVAITFDDGNENNYTQAYPVLKRFKFPATVFVIVEKIGRDGFLSWAQIVEMSNGGISIGSHTLTHRWLPGLDEQEAKKEIITSKRILEERLKKEIAFFSYPVGGFNNRIKGMVREAGYKGACATNPGKDFPKDDPYALKRLRISRHSDNLFVFWINLSGFYTWIKEHRDED